MSTSSSRMARPLVFSVIGIYEPVRRSGPAMSGHRVRAFLLVLISGLAGVITAFVGSSATADNASTAELARSLAHEPDPGEEKRTTRHSAASQARALAGELGRRIPLPTGGNFDGIRWETVPGTVTTSDIETSLEYNATCQWLRARRVGRDAATSAQVLEVVAQWPALRGTESARVVVDAVAQSAAGQGDTLAGVLADCEASHLRERAYALASNLEAPL